MNKFKKSLLGTVIISTVLSGHAIADATVIQIATPDKNGVSMNNHDSFNVGKEGVVLNNSYSNINTTLAGKIKANDNIFMPAKTIINQVAAGGKASSLNGAIEVAGRKADVYIANPAGIDCSGCSFINASRAVLVSGTVDRNKISTMNMGNGTVTFNGAGFNSDVTDLDIYTRQLLVNAPVKAKNVTVTIDTPLANQVAVDVTALGSVKANSIYMIAKEKGMGVNNQGILQASGELTITNAGKLINANVLSGKHVTVRKTAETQNLAAGQIIAAGWTDISSDNIVNNGAIHGQDIDLSGNTLHNSGNIASTKTMMLNSTHAVNEGTITAKENLMFLTMKSMDNAKGTIAAKRIRSYSFSPVQAATLNGKVVILK